MKSSHFTTPRTMNDGQWAYNADPIERFETHRIDWQDKLVLWACIAAAVAVIVIMVME
jgi:hypothetical protein